MHIKRMREMIEKLTEIALCELDKGAECVNTKEFGEVTDMIKDLAEAEYKSRISKAMEEAEEEDKAEEKYMLKMLKEDYGMNEEESRRYYDAWRYKNGRFAPKGRGTRRGYEEPPYYHMTPEMYRDHDAEWYRDMDRKSRNVMYFSEPIRNSDSEKHVESRYDRAKRMYTETKDMHKSGSVEDKQITLKEGEKMLNVIFDEIDEMLADATPEMKNMVKTKAMTRIQKIQ